MQMDGPRGLPLLQTPAIRDGPHGSRRLSLSGEVMGYKRGTNLVIDGVRRPSHHYFPYVWNSKTTFLGFCGGPLNWAINMSQTRSLLRIVISGSPYRPGTPRQGWQNRLPIYPFHMRNRVGKPRDLSKYREKRQRRNFEGARRCRALPHYRY